MTAQTSSPSPVLAAGSTAVLPAEGPAPPRVSPTVAGLAAVAPERRFDQDELLDLLGLADDEFAQRIFARCGIRNRHLELTPELLRTTLQARAGRTEDHLFELAVAALEQIEFDPAEVGVLVTGSFWTLGGPTLGHRLIEHLGLPTDVDKYHLVGLGCASSVPLFRAATSALGDRPDETALVVAAESLSGLLTWAGPGAERGKIVASALFGDGCGAALLHPDGAAAGPTILASAVHQVPDTLGHVELLATADDSQVRISPELPRIAESGLLPLVDSFLAGAGLTVGDVEHWLVHPGGRGIVDGVQAGLDLADEVVAPSRAVLAEYGNVGTPSAFFVFEEVVRQRSPRAGDHGLVVTIGPGVTVGLLLLRW
ncbi:MAG: hypothetical protein GXY03_09915 [Solirubrobacterales bacterium]|nr:hypothetical protein [Solirubrobacterales bacterium]